MKKSRVFSSESVNTKKHWLVGTKWPIIGSTGSEYEVEMVDSGFACSCPAFRKCKHITQVEERLCDDLC